MEISSNYRDLPLFATLVYLSHEAYRELETFKCGVRTPGVHIQRGSVSRGDVLGLVGK